jgi:hypothetical protein
MSSNSGGPAYVIVLLSVSTNNIHPARFILINCDSTPFQYFFLVKTAFHKEISDCFGVHHNPCVSQEKGL